MSYSVLLCAGGTGGHLFPAIAVAERLKSEGQKVFLLTDLRGQQYVPSGLFDSVSLVPTVRFDGPIQKRWLALKTLFSALCKTFRILRYIRPHVVWGFGGVVSFMPIFLGKVRLIPTGFYQADTILGRANHYLKPFVNRITTGFEYTWGLSSLAKVSWVGFPVRGSIRFKPYQPPSSSDPLRLLILGGSQGAQVFSALIPQVVGRLPTHLQERLCLHQQCRPDLLAETKDLYDKTRVKLKVEPFIEDVGAALAWADLVITRAGASVIGELACVGRSALFIPYPYATQNHQMENARQVVDQEGGWSFHEAALRENDTPLLQLLEEILETPQILSKKAESIRRLYVPDAAGCMSSWILSLARS